VSGRSHLVVPDMQIRPGISLSHIDWIAQYIVDRAPDELVVLGDWWDMASLSSYDKGKKSFEGRRYMKDISVGCEGMDRLLFRAKKTRRWRKMRRKFLMGNHENRAHRVTEDNAEYDGIISDKDFQLESHGFEVFPFLEIAEVDGVAYSHFFPRSGTGKITQGRNGAPSAAAQLIREGRSCTAGHAQGLDVACRPLRGSLQWGIIAGSAYRHDEEYLTPQGTAYWRGVIVKNDVRQGTYSPIFVDLGYLQRRYA
jgi:hypothetical protein